MKKFDYLKAKTLEKLGPSNYEQLRHYLQFVGYNISNQTGHWFEYYKSVRNSDEYIVILNDHGNLIPSNTIDPSCKNEVTYDQALKMINLLPDSD